MVFIRNAFILKTNSCLLNHLVDISKLHSSKIINIDFHQKEIDFIETHVKEMA